MLTVPQARFRLGMLPGEDLPDLACRLLECGIDTPAVRQLAGLVRPTLLEAGALFERVLRETKQPALSMEQARKVAVEEILNRITEGRTDSYTGAVELSRYWEELGYLPELAIFTALADEFEEHRAERDAIAADIQDRARKLLSSWRERM